MTWIPRFHLSTALVMTLVAGVMLGLNFRRTKERTEKDGQIFCGRRELIEQEAFPKLYFRGPMTIQYFDCGWPQPWRHGMEWSVESETRQIKRGSNRGLDNNALMIDVGVALVFVVACGFLFERFVARSNGRAK